MELDNYDPEADYEYVMMALSNMDDPQLLILPYNRAVRSEEDFDRTAFLEGLSENFDFIDIDPEMELSDQLAALPRTAFAVGLTEGDPFIAQLKEDVDIDSAIDMDRTDVWKRLDVTVLHKLVIDPLFHISLDRFETLDRIGFSKDGAQLLARTRKGTWDAAFLLRPTRIDQLRDVSLAGESMPQKSTYFYPKLPTGFVFRELTDMFKIDN